MKDKVQYIEVAPALPVQGAFTYETPENLKPYIEIGKRVLIPFQNRQVTGYVIAPAKSADGIRVKKILDVLDDVPLFSADMVPFFRWISDYYLYPLGEVIRGALPKGINIADYASAAITEAGMNALSSKSLPPMENSALSTLSTGAMPLKSLMSKLDNPPRTFIKNMEKKGHIRLSRKLGGVKTKTRQERFAMPSGREPEAVTLTEKRKNVFDTLSKTGELSVKALNRMIPNASSTLKFLEENGLVSTCFKTVYRDPFGDPVSADTPPTLTNEQQEVIDTVCRAFDSGFQRFLLNGVTGSGKTEVYMRLASAAVERNLSAIILVPEIALISQTERRFRARFGDCVAVLHSGLSAGERYDQWMKIARKEVRIVIGVRSAIFAPIEKPGIIIVDEEHDTSYKQDTKLMYNARDLAIVRARFEKGIVLLGSATPSVQSWYNVKSGKFKELVLKNRVNRKPLPEIEIVDLRNSKDQKGIRKFISNELYRAMRQALDNKEQVLLFLNRRGFANFPVCHACGEPLKCIHCDITLTLHQKTNAYRCHLCGYSRASASCCLSCGSPDINNYGMGTEKIEAAVKMLFPDSATARLDNDTTRTKGAMLKILKKLKNRETDILIGTQMVAKGHDFPGITMVGIICADMSLNLPDFRAGERTFQVLAQVAGRAGRGEKPGKVVMQTYNPDHFSIIAARNQDFKRFYANEISFRKSLLYPPFSRLVQIRISGKDKAATGRFAHETGETCRHISSLNPHLSPVMILGPIEAPVPRIAGFHRWQILLKSHDYKALREFLSRFVFGGRKPSGANGIKMAVDVDPFSMM